jgi:hypothetical protein
MLAPAQINASTVQPRGAARPRGTLALPACRLHLRVRQLPRRLVPLWVISGIRAWTTKSLSCASRTTLDIATDEMILAGRNAAIMTRLTLTSAPICGLLTVADAHQDTTGNLVRFPLLSRGHLGLPLRFPIGQCAGSPLIGARGARSCLTECKSAAGDHLTAHTNQHFRCLASRRSAPARSPGPPRPFGCICGLGSWFGNFAPHQGTQGLALPVPPLPTFSPSVRLCHVFETVAGFGTGREVGSEAMTCL